MLLIMLTFLHVPISTQFCENIKSQSLMISSDHNILEVKLIVWQAYKHASCERGLAWGLNLSATIALISAEYVYSIILSWGEKGSLIDLYCIHRYHALL